MSEQEEEQEESYMADCSICKEQTFHSNEFDGWVRCSICGTC
jgi:hypothetical protein